MKEKFKKTQYKAHTNPVNYYNNFVETDKFVEDIKQLEVMTDKSATIKDTSGCIYRPSPDITGYYTLDGQPCSDSLSDGGFYSKFELLQVIRFDGNFNHTLTYVQTKHMNAEWPYIIVGKDYYKIIPKKNVFGVVCNELKPFNTQIITKRHGKLGDKLTTDKAYDDFVIEPNNIEYHPTIDGFYNLYHPFPHEPYAGKVTSDDISYTIRFMQHVFGSQVELGMYYIKIMYEEPKQQLPLLVLVSKERQTGKTSFLNFLSMLFGANYVQVSPDDLTSDFNAVYATKNVIGVDETVIDKRGAIERIKSLVTSKTIVVNQKNITQYAVPFYGKLIMTSNRENDFIRIDAEEIRFWVRKLSPFGRVDQGFFDKLKEEIPLFLRYLLNLPKREYRSRMVFSAEEIKNNQLDAVVKESKSGLYKELHERIREHFESTHLEQFEATLSDLKTKWFEYDSKISIAYLKKVIEEEMGYEKQKMKRYIPLDDTSPIGTRPGTPYLFTRNSFTAEGNGSSDIISNTYNDESPF
jgi:hypothetical protein